MNYALYDFVVNEVLKRIDNNIEKFKNKNVENIVIIGETKAGKSTWGNLMLSKEFEIVRSNLITLELENKKDEEAFDIGNIELSKTDFPKGLSNDNKIAYWDLPGFNDNREGLQVLFNALYIQKLLETLPSAKLVFVIKNEDLGKLKPLKGLLAITGDNVSLLENSVLFLINGWELNDDQKPKEILSKIIDGLKKENNENYEQKLENFKKVKIITSKRLNIQDSDDVIKQNLKNNKKDAEEALQKLN